MTGRCLIVANQTLGGAALDAAVRDCIDRGVTRFHVVAPMTRVHHESPVWSGGFAIGEYTPPEVVREVVDEASSRHAAEVEEAARRAQQRLERMLDTIRSLGGEADGRTGVDDPLEATRAALAREPDVVEVIVSTLPSGLSRWLRMDLPARVARLTDVPVTTIEAEADEPA